MRRAMLAVVCGVFVMASARERPAEPQGGATITGKVKFTGTKPANPKIDMSEEPKCKAKYQAPPTEETVVVNPNGTLANVFVYVKSGLPESYKAPAPAGAVTLDQDGCRYHPHVLGILVGQPLEIKNSDGILHNIKAKGTKNRPFNISQPTTMTSTRTFAAPEVMVPLECNVHGWLGVLPHPFYGVSGADGSFSIKGLPPGTYTIEAWQEKYGTQTASVTVAGSETKTQDFTLAEVIWTTIPAVTMVALGLISNHYWVRIKGRNSVPANAYPIAIHAKQFEWQVTYPGADGQLGTPDDFTVRNQLHVPVGRPVVVHLSSEDVIHSFFVPVFRVKQDAVPGMDINAWFQATVPGTYELGCAELCGLGHYRMRAQVVVHTQEDYDAWMKQAAQEASQ